MNKKERFKAVCEKRAPDVMPVWPRVMSQMIYSHGLMLTDVTGQDWYDSDKVTEAVLANIGEMDYDVALPTYMDYGFGIPPLGGKIAIPQKFGIAAGTTDDQPVKTKEDWPKIQKLLAKFDPRTADPRMKGALEVITNVSREIGEHTPLATLYYVGTTAAMFLFRPNEAFLTDIFEDPDWVDEMCKLATDWCMDWIRAQYEAGANSCAIIAETLGTLMISPRDGERFNLPNIARVVEMVKKEFNQDTWLHIHGDMSRPKAYEYLTKLATQTGLIGFHFDEMNRADWIKEKVVDKFGVSACIITDGAKIVNGPIEKIHRDVKEEISQIGDGLGIMMAPSCQVLPATSKEHFKAWVDATHEYGKYPLSN